MWFFTRAVRHGLDVRRVVWRSVVGHRGEYRVPAGVSRPAVAWQVPKHFESARVQRRANSARACVRQDGMLMSDRAPSRAPAAVRRSRGRR